MIGLDSIPWQGGGLSIAKRVRFEDQIRLRFFQLIYSTMCRDTYDAWIEPGSPFLAPSQSDDIHVQVQPMHFTLK